MHSHMRVKFRHLVEALAADVAYVTPNAAMFLHMLTQCGMTPERFVTLITLEWLLACVQSEVYLSMFI